MYGHRTWRRRNLVVTIAAGLVALWFLAAGIGGVVFIDSHIGPDSCGTVIAPHDYGRTVTELEAMQPQQATYDYQNDVTGISSLIDRAEYLQANCPSRRRTYVLVSIALLVVAGGLAWLTAWDGRRLLTAR